jgi:hypothetical protein
MRGSVVYVAAEGAGGLAKRIKALMEHYQTNGEPPVDFYFIDQAVNLLEPGTVAEAVAAVKDLDVHPKLVVFDTYARSMVGGDENSAKDAGLAISSIDRMRFELGAAVLVIHHTGKTGDEERGSGALRGAADTMMKLTRTPSSLLLTVDKQKNFVAGPPIRLRLDQVADSLVPAEQPTTTSAPINLDSPPTQSTRELEVRTEILARLSHAQTSGADGIKQTELLKGVTGNQSMKIAVLHQLVGEADLRIVMEERGKSKVYRLSS